MAKIFSCVDRDISLHYSPLPTDPYSKIVQQSKTYNTKNERYGLKKLSRPYQLLFHKLWGPSRLLKVSFWAVKLICDWLIDIWIKKNYLQHPWAKRMHYQKSSKEMFLNRKCLSYQNKWELYNFKILQNGIIQTRNFIKLLLNFAKFKSVIFLLAFIWKSLPLSFFSKNS